MPGLLDFLGMGGDTQAQSTPGLLDPRAIRQQALFQGLSALGAGLLAAGQRRPALSPSPLPQALASFGPAYQQGVLGGYQSNALARQSDQDSQWDQAAAGNPMLRLLGPTAGRQALASSFNRENQDYTLGEGQERRRSDGTLVASGPPRRPRIEITRDGYIVNLDEVGGQGGGAATPGGGSTLADRNNSPGNLRPPGQSTGLRRFDSPEEGAAQMVRQLDIYRNRDRLNTVSGIVSTYAPPNENDTASYVRNVAMRMGVPADQPIDTSDPQVMRRLAMAMARQEGGRPLPPEAWDQAVTTARQPRTQQTAQAAPAQLPRGIIGQLPQRAESDNAITAVPDPTSPTGFRNVRRAEAVGQPAVGPSTMQVVADGHGGFTVQHGPGTSTTRPGNMAQPTVNTIESQIINNTARLQRVDDIMRAFRPEFQTIAGQFTDWTTAWAERLGATLPPERLQAHREFTEFRSRTALELGETLKAMSGGAVTPQEADRLLAAIGDPASDSPTQFRTKMRNVQRSVRLANARLHYYRRNGMPPALDGIPLSDMQSIINRRGDQAAQQMRDQGIAAEEIPGRVDATLASEFGI